MAITVRLTNTAFCSQRFGGISRYFVELLKHLTDDPTIDMRVNAHFHSNQYLEEAKNDVGFKGRMISQQFKGKGTLMRAFNCLYASLFPKFDILHSTYYDRFPRSNLKYGKITTFYDMIHERFSTDQIFAERKKQSLLHSDCCIAISEATKKDMVHFLGANPDLVSVVHLASSIEMPINYKKTPNHSILWVGGRSWYKNFDGFLRGFVLSKAFVDEVGIVCAGGGEPTPEEKEFINRLGIRQDRIKFLRPNDIELAKLYVDSLCLVYGSLYEGFGIPPLEAMACGCVVAAGCGGSLPEVVGNAGLLFDPTAPEAIAASIDTLVYNTAEAELLRDAGFNRATLFTWEKCARETARIYRDLHSRQQLI